MASLAPVKRCAYLNRVVLDLSPIARTVVDDFAAAPCAVLAALQRRSSSHILTGYGCAGRLGRVDDAPHVALDTVFDLASLTKPLTSLTVARLQARGSLDRAEPLGALLPQARGTASEGVSIDLLLSHRAGLIDHLPLYAPLQQGQRVVPEAALRAAADGRRPECVGPPPEEGFAPVYSDLGYMLVGAALEARTGEPLDTLVEREVSDPLGLDIGSARQWRARRADFDETVAPTEDVTWRGGVIRGSVHDENAWALTADAASGHAGLFGHASDVAQLGLAILEALHGARPGWLDPDDFTPVLRARPGGSHRAGFDSKSGETSSAGRRFGPRTFGHLGFTGTSIWIDPDAELCGVLLTNRVHPSRQHIAIRAARPKVYDAIYEQFSNHHRESE